MKNFHLPIPETAHTSICLVLEHISPTLELPSLLVIVGESGDLGQCYEQGESNEKYYFIGNGINYYGYSASWGNFRDCRGPKLTFASINFREWTNSEILQVLTFTIWENLAKFSDFHVRILIIFLYFKSIFRE